MKRGLGMLALAAVTAAVLMGSALQWFSWYWQSGSGGYVKELAATGWIENEQEWHRRYEELQARRALVPLDARWYWQLGEMHRWRAAGMRLSPGPQQREIEAAKRQYNLAIAHSPRNGELWSRVAFRLAHANDGAAIPLMRRALDIAPHEPVVQYHLADVGLRYWEQLDPDDKRSFLAMLSQAMTRGHLAAQIRRMAKDHGRLDLLAGLNE